MIGLRLLFICLLLNLSFSFAEKPSSSATQEDKTPQLPDVWASVINYYPQTPEFSKKIWDTKNHLLGDRLQGLFQFWLKQNQKQLGTVSHNFLGYSYRSVGDQLEISWRQGYEAPTIETIEKLLILIHGYEQNAEFYSVLGDVLTINNHPELACRAYAKAIQMGHPQQERLKKMQTSAFKRLGVQNPEESAENIRSVFAAETAVIADWHKHYKGYRGTPPFWDRQLRVWAVPEKHFFYKQNRFHRLQLIGGIVLASITLVIALLLNQVFIRRLRPLNPKKASTTPTESAHHHHH